MQTFENYLTHNGKEDYLCTEYDFDHADQLVLADFAMRDENGEDIAQRDMEANQDFYRHVCSVLANEHAVCHGGAPV